jgi:hypothetical protein
MYSPPIRLFGGFAADSACSRGVNAYSMFSCKSGSVAIQWLLPEMNPYAGTRRIYRQEAGESSPDAPLLEPKPLPLPARARPIEAGFVFVWLSAISYQLSAFSSLSNALAR